MEKTNRDILTDCLENLDDKDLKRFRVKLEDLGLTKRKVVDAKEDSDLAKLMIETFGDDEVFNKTENILRFIKCNDSADKLRKEVSQAQQAPGASGTNASGSASGTPLSEDWLWKQKRYDQTEVYSMNNKPRGTCVIFNNVNFIGGEPRFGSDKDADDLKNTFKKLGFNVEILRDKRVQEMKDKIEELRKKVTGDCFVCCVLSHGNEKGVKGSCPSDPVLPIPDILSPFSGSKCPALAGKPKVFFIQACRGSSMEKEVTVQADSLDENNAHLESNISLDSIISLPDFADLLISMSTFEGYYSLRDPHSGSWFIQSLCEHLDKLCPKGEDMLSILTKVNNYVAAESGRTDEGILCKQIPEPRFTLRKKLIFYMP